MVLIKFDAPEEVASNFKAFAGKNNRCTYAEALEKLLQIAEDASERAKKTKADKKS